jgi:hypothetical protein
MKIKYAYFGGIVALVFLLLFIAPASFSADGKDASSLLIGNWYGERVHSGQIQGKAFNHRRWLTTHRPDGTAQDIYRYYLNGQLQGEETENYTWGVKDGIYWNVCQSTSLNGASKACSHRSEYAILSINSQEFRYRSLKSGIDYSMVRVPADFRLP